MLRFLLLVEKGRQTVANVGEGRSLHPGKAKGKKKISCLGCASYLFNQHPVLEIKQRALHQVDNIWDWVLGLVVGKLTRSFFRYEPNTETGM